MYADSHRHIFDFKEQLCSPSCRASSHPYLHRRFPNGGDDGGGGADGSAPFSVNSPSSST